MSRARRAKVPALRIVVMENEKMAAFKQYRRKQSAELIPWEIGMSLPGVSISKSDADAGSPREGDMIARNPDNHADQWLISAEYFAKNFEE